MAVGTDKRRVMAGSDEAPPDPGEITRLLASISEGDRHAINRLFPIVYAELRVLAHRQLAHIHPGDTLQATALVHEAYLKLLGTARPEWHDRRHFFAVASRAMRQITIDYARTRAAQKRGGDTPTLTLDEEQLPVADRAHELVLLDQALTELESLSERPARVVELRFFGGLSVEETAAVMEVSERTVKREWQKARAFLFDALRGDGLR
jgi:RNA polymerase sigma factor (TIGR02999 family)